MEQYVICSITNKCILFLKYIRIRKTIENIFFRKYKLKSLSGNHGKCYIKILKEMIKNTQRIYAIVWKM